MHAAMCLAFPPVLQLLPSQVSLSEVKRPNSLRLACFDSDRFCQSLPIMSGVNAYDRKIHEKSPHLDLLILIEL